MPYKNLFFFLLILSLSSTVHANALNETSLSSLAKDNYWLKLVHYDSTGEDKYKSAIISDEFFLSQNGESSPESELRATINAIKAPIDNPNLHAICRFPERYHWIKSQIELENVTPPPNCSAFIEWQGNEPVESVSLILATGYLSNPASFYGHLLLKFGGTPTTENNYQDLLSTSINYGAIVPPNENGLVYIFKGLFGGYEAGYTPGQYYEHSHNYADIELRDVWEYQLNLNTDETMQLLRHSWELIDNKLIYYYAKENCAYRIAELLSLVLDEPLEDRSAKWTFPITIIEDLSEYEHNQKPLITDSIKRTSRQNLFYEKYYQLNRSQRDAVKSVSETNTFESTSYLTLTSNEKIEVVDTLLDYYELLLKNSDKTSDKQGKQKVLIEMLQLSAITELPKWKELDAKRPEEGSSPQLIRIGGINNEHGNNSTLINWRLAYFDMLNIDTGTLPYSKLSMFDVSLELVNSNLKLKHLDFLDIDTLGLPSTNLRGDKRYSWALNAGIGRTDNQCNNCTVGFITAEWGKALKIGNNSALYARGTSQLQTSDKTTSKVQLGIHLGGIITLTDWWKIKLDYEEAIGLESNRFEHTSIEQRFGSSRDWDIRIRYDKSISKEYTVSAGYYF